MNSAPPDWQDGECCFRCRTLFTLVARKHHCRNCGNIFCAKCSSQQIPIPKLNLDKAVRVCDNCYEKLFKEESSLALAMDTNKSSTPSIASTATKDSSTSSKSTTNKPATSASAPSEQELKEEEELQLALALSLSEPAKISFPNLNQLEQSAAKLSSKPASEPLPQTAGVYSPTPEVTTTSIKFPEVAPPATTVTEASGVPVPTQVSEKDRDLSKLVADIQMTTDVFMNRIESSQKRNRPIASDSAIQGMFLKITNMHTELMKHIEEHERERAHYEALQDKITNITDARAALDALREEHQDKIRKEAVEAERLRQTQLASKLEVMRQKKAQVLQYQREIALQRIQEQEATSRAAQQAGTTKIQTQEVVNQPVIAGTQNIPTPIADHYQYQQYQHQQQIPYQHRYSEPNQFNDPSQFQPTQNQPVEQAAGINHYQMNNQQVPPQHVQQASNQPPIDEEAPLISFDD